MDRATGRTTRLVDKYIQDLFQNPNEFLIVQDHTNLADSNLNLLVRIKTRLNYEFPNVEYVADTFDLGKLRIKLNR